MALKSFKPYTKSTRGTVLIDRSKLWKGKPFKPLTSVNNSSKGRNNLGRITSRNHGGGHKQKYRKVDFRITAFHLLTRNSEKVMSMSKMTFFHFLTFIWIF